MLARLLDKYNLHIGVTLAALFASILLTDAYVRWWDPTATWVLITRNSLFVLWIGCCVTIWSALHTERPRRRR